MATERTRPLRRDVALGASTSIIALALLALVPLLVAADADIAADAPHAQAWALWVLAAIVVAQGSTLAWITVDPPRTLVVAAALAVAASGLPAGGVATATFVPVAAAAYVAARRRGPGGSWRPWALAVMAVLAAGAVGNARGGEAWGISVAAAAGQAAVVVGVPAAIAVAVGARAQIRESRERELLALAHEQEARMDAALAAERTAIARELHDIAAHHLSGIAVMTSAISQQVDSDPATAKESLAQVRAEARTLLDELRGLVTLLRHDDDAGAAVQSLAGLEDLTMTAARRGADVTLDLPTGSTLADLARGIGPLSQFAAYRTVQEALANAARHAPGASCTVAVRPTDSGLELEVVSGPGETPAAAHPGGFGLRGMQERATLTRSALTYGPTDDGGWRVALRIPRDQQEETS